MKYELREYYWKLLSNCRELVSFFDNKLKKYYCPFQQRNNFGFFAVNINAKIGFFAQLTWCLYILDYCDRCGLKPILILSSPLYTVSKADNWLDYFFSISQLLEEDKKNLENGGVKVSNISDIKQLGLPTDGPRMTLEYANYLRTKYLPINHEIVGYVNSFINAKFGNTATLGLHYRGTDKKFEANPVEWTSIAVTVSNYLENNSQIDALFVASDERDFIKWIENEFGHRIRVLFHDDQEQGGEGIAIHANPSSGCNYTKGREALVNCLLLSKCHALIRTASFLSGWSSVFNPDLPVIMLNRPYAQTSWFPDDVIVQNSMDEYLPDNLKKNI